MYSNSANKTSFDELFIDDEFNSLVSPLPSEDEDSNDGDGSQNAPANNQSEKELQEAAARTDAEKVEDLFKEMPPHRRVLLSVLEFCLEKQRISVVEAQIDEMQQHNFSIYNAANFCNFLEQAGAIIRVTEEGASLADAKVEPLLVEEDGIEYLKPGTPVETFWITSEAGRAYLEADDPLERLRDLFEKEQSYYSIYKRVLLLCSTEGGKTVAELGKDIDDDPLLQNPRLFVQHFVDSLEKCDALAWEKPWKTTSIGLLGIKEIEKFEEAKELEEAQRATGGKA